MRASALETTCVYRIHRCPIMLDGDILTLCYWAASSSAGSLLSNYGQQRSSGLQTDTDRGTQFDFVTGCHSLAQIDYLIIRDCQTDARTMHECMIFVVFVQENQS